MTELEDKSIDIIPDAEVIAYTSATASEGTLSVYTYLLLPMIFLVVTLLGGLRLGAADNAFVFLKPPLVCLVLAAFILVSIVRSHLILLDGWLSRARPPIETCANAAIMLTLFTATVQVLNSLLPEQGLPFWVVGFCFFWTLWNNLFAEFETKRMIRSFAALFGLAFVTKYLVLSNMTATSDAGWLTRIIQDPTKETVTWLLDLPRYSAGTGYIQFFTLALYLIGLYLTPRSPRTN